MSLPAPMSLPGHNGTPQEVHGTEWHGQWGPPMYRGRLPEGGREEAKGAQKEPGQTRELVDPGLWGGGGDPRSRWVAKGKPV